MTRILYDLEGAAQQVSHSPKLLRRAIHTTDPKSYPPPLAAKVAGKQDGRHRFLITHKALVEWAESLPDA